MKNKKILFFIIFIILILVSLFVIFNKRTSKVFKIGNNKTSQEIVEYVLNINSYEANITVEVESNKNNNKYILIQKFASPNISSQEVLEPNNIAGVKIINDGQNLKVENSSLNLSTIYENYSYLGNNCLDLSSFIEDYKIQNNSNFIEEENQIIMYTESKMENEYAKYKTLYIDKETYKPTKMEIKDISEKTTIYILYNKVEINSIDKDNILAFRLYDKVDSI